MTNPDYTAILLIIDRSGSMGTIRREAENSINAFLDGQRKEPGKTTVRIVDFDFEYNLVTPSIDLNDFEKYTLMPRGSTALHDAMGRGIVEFGEELAALKEEDRPGKVIVVTLTDGHENASQDWNADSVKTVVEHQTAGYNWNFVFLAANQNAILTAQQFGIARGSSLTFGTNEDGLESMSVAMGEYVTQARSGRSYEFSEEDRTKSMG